MFRFTMVSKKMTITCGICYPANLSIALISRKKISLDLSLREKKNDCTTSWLQSHFEHCNILHQIGYITKCEEGNKCKVQPSDLVIWHHMRVCRCLITENPRTNLSYITCQRNAINLFSNFLFKILVVSKNTSR